MFTCQKNSFLKEVETEIVSCTPVTEIDKGLSIDPKIVEGKKLYKIILRDTLFFPEGGGQPDDNGSIKGGPDSMLGKVIRVIRNGTQAEHYVTSDKITDSLWTKGDKVLTTIDWERRFDHMQQHSGQHLITAVADTVFGYPTTSWYLGAEESFIELDTKEITDDQVKAIEKDVNEKIRAKISVDVEVVGLEDPKLKIARGRNLPEDVKGDIRIVSIIGVEANVCCGTHVTNLSQLQVIKLLNVVKKKGKCLLYFVCGERVISKFHAMFKREQKLTEILKTSQQDLPTAGEKLNIALKNVRKSNQNLSKDLAALVAKDFKDNGGEGTSKLWQYHRDNADLDFGMSLLREIGDNKKSSIVLVTIKTEGSSGYLLLTGGEDVIDKEKLIKMGEEICSILDGKGSLQRGNVYQAKVNKINLVNKAQKMAEQLVEAHFKTTAAAS